MLGGSIPFHYLFISRVANYALQWYDKHVDQKPIIIIGFWSTCLSYQSKTSQTEKFRD